MGVITLNEVSVQVERTRTYPFYYSENPALEQLSWVFPIINTSIL